jgi:hypothetical protein
MVQVRGKVVGPPAWSPSKGMGSAEDWLDNGIEWSRIDKHSRGSCTSVDPPRWFSLNGVVLRSACQTPFTMQAVAHDAYFFLSHFFFSKTRGKDTVFPGGGTANGISKR